MTRLEELTQMIRRGWGDVPQNQIPEDWPKRWGPGNYKAECNRESRKRIAEGIILRDLDKWKVRREEYLAGKGFSPGTQFGLPFSFPETG